MLVLSGAEIINFLKFCFSFSSWHFPNFWVNRYYFWYQENINLLIGWEKKTSWMKEKLAHVCVQEGEGGREKEEKGR